jgi:hypothetical protein
MKQRPRIFVLEAIYFLAVAVSIPLQIALMYEHDVHQLGQIMQKVTSINWLVIASCLLNSVLALKAHSLLKMTLPLSIVVVWLNNSFVAYDGQDFGHLMPMLASLGHLLVLLSFYASQDKRTILMHPNMRWWQIPPRVRHDRMVWLGIPGNEHLTAMTFDISEGGLFIAFPNNLDKRWTDAAVGGLASVYLKLENGESINMWARIVRKEVNSKGLYPLGLGLKIETLGQLGKKRWSGLLQEAFIQKETPWQNMAA